ncbi:MAG: biotin/lipoyl-containing protein, partial [Dokdonella sp.]
MANTVEVKVPDIGNFKGVPVIEILVKVGDAVAKDQGLVTLESDKATMEVPASVAGVVKEIRVKLNDEVAEGAVVVVIETSADAASSPSPPRGEGRGEGASAPHTAAPSAAVAAPLPSQPSSVKGQEVKAQSATPGPQAAPASGRKADIECQVVVLGSGPGGYTAAFRAADLGQTTVLIERYVSLGGVCLNVGCIPSKALLHAARVIDEAAHAADIGITFGAPKIDLDKLRANKDKVVAQMVGGLAGMAKQRKVTVVQGTGTFISPNEIEVDGEGGKKLVRFE